MAPMFDGTRDCVAIIEGKLKEAHAAEAQRNFGIATGHYQQANKVLYDYRDAFVRALPTHAGQPTIVFPVSMKTIDDALKGLRTVSLSLPSQGDLTSSQLNRLLGAMRAFVLADAEFARSASARSANPDLAQPKVSLALSLNPFPIELELLGGEFRVRKAFHAGPLGATVGVSNQGTRQGVTKLVLIHGDSKRVYAVGNRVLSFDVPESHVQVDSQVMTITTK